MNKKDLIDLGVAEDVADKIVVLHGKDIEKFKSDVTTLQTERDTLKTQLTEAGTTIESFKAMKPDELKIAADEYKAKYEQAQTEAAAQLQKVRFDHALETALMGAKVKNVKAVSALLDTEQMTLNKDGSLHGLDKQLEKIKSENDFLFEGDTKQPRFASGGGQGTTIPNISAFEAAVNKGGGFGEKQQGK